MTGGAAVLTSSVRGGPVSLPTISSEISPLPPSQSSIMNAESSKIVPWFDQFVGKLLTTLNEARLDIVQKVEARMPDVILALLLWDASFLVYALLQNIFQSNI